MIEYIELKLLGSLETISRYLCWPVPAKSCRYECVCVCVCLFSLGLQVGVGDTEKQIPLVPIWLNFLILLFFFFLLVFSLPHLPSFLPLPSLFPDSALSLEKMLLNHIKDLECVTSIPTLFLQTTCFWHRLLAK